MAVKKLEDYDVSIMACVVTFKNPAKYEMCGSTDYNYLSTWKKYNEKFSLICYISCIKGIIVLGSRGTH